MQTNGAALWRNPQPLILASNSATRRALLVAAGIMPQLVAAQIDERAIEASLVALGATPSAIALALARAKAAAVSVRYPGHLVLGADQVLAHGETLFHKPENIAAAARHLQLLSGQSHHLHSALSVHRDGSELFSTVDCAVMTMRLLSGAFIATYLQMAAPAVLASVGGYQVEGLGIHLFEKIEGAQATILGLPLLALLAFLRQDGSLAS